MAVLKVNADYLTLLIGAEGAKRSDEEAHHYRP